MMPEFLERLDKLERSYKLMDQAIERIDLTIFQLTEQVRILTAQMAGVVESQEADESEYVRDLRRALLVVGLTEILVGWYGIFGSSEVNNYDEWETVCAEFYRRYGHLTAAGKPLWTKPPKAPSAETKAKIAKALKIR
jgi:hypothetical protein